MALNATANKIITVAQELVQTRGYNAFSYRDLAERIGIKTSSIHYYFPNKEDLGAAMMRAYRERAVNDLARIDAAEPRDRQRLQCYIKTLSAIFKNGERLCPWAMLATDFNTLPEQIRVEVRAFYRLNESWLEQRLEAARQAGDLSFPGSARVAAETFFAMLEGALLSARVIGDSSRLSRVYGWMETLMATR